MENLVAPKELAKILNVPLSWVYAQSRQTGHEAIPRLKIGKYLRFRLDDVFDWIARKNAGVE